MPIIKQRIICLNIDDIKANDILFSGCYPMFLTIEEAKLIKERIDATIEFAKTNDIEKFNEDAYIQIEEQYKSHVERITDMAKEFNSIRGSTGFGNKTKVYIMIDKNTGYYKIGRSIKPKKRESTLQSEKPTIEMLFYFEATKDLELNLHKHFSSKRVRGEWFNLTNEDLDYIKQIGGLE